MSDLYALLEIEPGSDGEQVRRAYYRLARLYHPDLQGNAANEETHERFLRIQEAYEVLGTPLSKQKYDEELRDARKSPGASADKTSKPATAPARRSGKERSATATATDHGTPSGEAARGKKVSLDDVRKARQAFMRAEELMEAGDVEKVATLMQAVVRVMDSEPEYLSLFGYALALEGNKLHLARDYCRRAVEAEPYSLEYKARLGYVYHRAGLQKTADTIFDEVLAVDEAHPIARAHHGTLKRGKGGLLGLISGLFSRS